MRLRDSAGTDRQPPWGPWSPSDLCSSLALCRGGPEGGFCDRSWAEPARAVGRREWPRPDLALDGSLFYSEQRLRLSHGSLPS